MSRGGETGGMSIEDALHEFEHEGYTGQFIARPGGKLECVQCSVLTPAENVARTALRRVEGVSDPDDMVSINALVCPACGSHGTAVFPYGPHASAEEGEVMSHLNPVHRALPGLAEPLLHPAEAETPHIASDEDEGLPGRHHSHS